MWDVALLLALLGLAYLLARNTLLNMAAAGVEPGFGFLLSEAGFDVSEALIPYDPSDSYARVILTGLLNTLFLSAVSLTLATLLGLGIGLLAVGPSPIGRAAAAGYVALFRNLPKILILLVLFVVSVNALPPVRRAIALGPVKISNRSLYFPMIEASPDLGILLIAASLGALLAWIWRGRARRVAERTGRRLPVLPVGLALIAGTTLLAALLFEAKLAVSTPELAGFDFQGGARLSLQFLVMAATLSLYHGAQIAEVVRGGVEAVPKGQVEAAYALGLDRRMTLRLIVIPQVVRIVIPPINNQYVNLIKNTSIAIAVGYSDLMSVAGTTINQTFRPLETMLLTMGLYLTICVALTSVLNRWNAALRRLEGRS